MAISQWAPPAADENNTPKAACQPPPPPLAQALPCPSTGARLTVVFLTFSVPCARGGVKVIRALQLPLATKRLLFWRRHEGGRRSLCCVVGPRPGHCLAVFPPMPRRGGLRPPNKGCVPEPSPALPAPLGHLSDAGARGGGGDSGGLARPPTSPPSPPSPTLPWPRLTDRTGASLGGAIVQAHHAVHAFVFCRLFAPDPEQPSAAGARHSGPQTPIPRIVPPAFPFPLPPGHAHSHANTA